MTWPALFGKAHVDKVLAGSVALGRLHHAYLFEGPVGVGKSFLATRAAAAYLCRDGGMSKTKSGAPRDSIEPCGECRNCKRILTHNHPDLVWFDDLTVERADRSQVQVAGMKQIPLSALEQLIKILARRPVEADRRAVVIRHVERLNPSAQNAFLKLLEEPPTGTLFLMTCANSHQLLKTILSRCQRLAVRPMTDLQIATALQSTGVPTPRAEEISLRCDGLVGLALAQAQTNPPGSTDAANPREANGLGTRGECVQWLELLAPANRLSQTGAFAATVVETIRERLEAQPALAAAAAADDEADDSDPAAEAESTAETSTPAGKPGHGAAKKPAAAKAAKSQVTANEAVRLAAQKVIADLAWTWHRSWQLSQGRPDPAGSPPLYAAPSRALIDRIGLQPLTLTHGYFEEATAALQWNVRVELVFKALAVRLAR